MMVAKILVMMVVKAIVVVRAVMMFLARWRRDEQTFIMVELLSRQKIFTN